MAVAGHKGSLLAIVGATTHCVVPLIPGGGRARHRVVTEGYSFSKVMGFRLMVSEAPELTCIRVLGRLYPASTRR